MASFGGKYKKNQIKEVHRALIICGFMIYSAKLAVETQIETA
ncbi:hypothetical protein [Butyrivibrio sp. AE3003]|nr:hypothetical protein [Butyrivibrio sp. AE3003]